MMGNIKLHGWFITEIRIEIDEYRQKIADLEEAARYHIRMISEMQDSDNVESNDEKNPAAVKLGRLGGLKGGKARARKLSAERRREIAQKAARARWG